MINIIIDKQGRPSKGSIFLGNQHENLDETLHFLFPADYDDYYKYVTYYYRDRRTGNELTGISPLVDGSFVITSAITKCAGMWELHTICKSSPIDLEAKVIDLTMNNSDKEHIFISDVINGRIGGNNIDVEAFENVAIDENIASLYDSILALKNRVEENDKIHEQNENIRKANELERQSAETTRKTNESERVSAEQLRIEAESARQKAETTRQSSESARVTAESLRDTAENARTSAENQRVENEKLYVQAERTRVNAEKERVQAETLRKQLEATRQEDEAVRQENESARVEVEKARVNAEKERVNAETERNQAESVRGAGENKRAEAETARQSTEANRAAAENIRIEAEKSRVNAEGGRVSAENERVKSETLRKQSEQTRSNEESTRQSAESARVSEENARKQAETARVTAEQSRVSVESQRVSAETNRANAERQRAEAETNRVNAEQSRVDAEALRVTADTERTNKTNTALKTLEDAVASEREKYSQHFFENAFALQRTGKVYTVKFPLWKASHLSEGEKLDDNAGLVLEPSTKTIRGRNDYKDIPLFKTYDVNAYVDDDGVRHVTAIKGDRNFKDTEKNDVFVLGMSYYEKTWADDQYWYYSRTDIPKDGYTIARECINRDGTTQPYTLCAKYVSSMIDGVYYSTKGQAPARACSNPKDNITSVDNSYYGLIRNCKKKGAFYTGGLMCEYKGILSSQWAMLGTTVPKTKIWGCTSCWGEPVASIQSTDKHTYFPVKKTDAVNYPVGCGVSVGYKHLNDDGTATLDRAYAEAHAYANDVKVLKKEPLDDNNVAIYLDTEEPFNTMPVQLSDTVSSEIYILSMHWQSGYSDDVLDRCGCPCDDKSGLTSGRYPMVWQGIELMVGGYETFANAFMDIVDLNTRDVYLTNDATQLTSDDATAKTTYKKLPYQMSVAKNSQWNYVTEIKLDLENGAFVQTQSGQDGSSSATGFGDAIRFDAATSGTREFLSLGGLDYGSYAGLTVCYGYGWLGGANWFVLARLSVNAVGGELTA